MAPSFSNISTAATSATRQMFYATSSDGVIDTEFLVVGAGPAGAALACFLGSYGELI